MSNATTTAAERINETNTTLCATGISCERQAWLLKHDIQWSLSNKLAEFVACRGQHDLILQPRGDAWTLINFNDWPRYTQTEVTLREGLRIMANYKVR